MEKLKDHNSENNKEKLWGLMVGISMICLGMEFILINQDISWKMIYHVPPLFSISLFCIGLIIFTYSFNYKEKRSNQANLTKDFRFFIRVDYSNYSYEQYKEILYKTAKYELEKEGNYDNVFISPFELFIEEKIKSRFSNKSINAFLINYSEKEGSLIITFGIHFFTAIFNYGQLRDSLVHLNNDINSLLKLAFGDDASIIVHRSIQSNSPSPNHITLGSIKVKLLFWLVIFSSLGFALYTTYKVETFPSKQTTHFLEQMVISEINKINIEANTKDSLKKYRELLNRNLIDSTKISTK
jgi:hypothetical protein